MLKVTSLFQENVRAVDTIVREVQDAARHLAVSTRSWSTIQPGRAAIDAALSTCTGLQRSLAELHAQTERERVA
jgi:hypothetical protein